MDLELQGKVALVTGASRGIGAAVTERLVAEGAHVIALSRSGGTDAAGGGPAVTHIAADLSTPEGCAQAVADAAAVHGRLDLLVNNAGGGERLSLAPFAALEPADWDDALAVNLLAAVHTTRAAASWLEQTAGTIVTVSSMGAHRVDGPPLAYNVAKAALTAFGRGVAPELAALGIRYLTVTPGPTRTAMWDRFAEAAGAPVEAVLAKIPDQMGMLTGRLLEPREVADLIVYAASPRAAGIYGSDLVIDGGALRGA